MLKPTSDNLIVEPIKEEEKTKSGILLSPTNQRKGDQGLVVSVGSNVTEAKKGDVVYFAQYAATELNHEGVIYVVLKEADLFAVVSKK